MLQTYGLFINRDLDSRQFAELMDHVSERRREKICQFHRIEDKQRSLLGEALARFAICKKLGINNENLQFGSNEYGKPVLIVPNMIHFNISHSGNWVFCSISDYPVGVDVEIVKPIDLNIAERFFTKHEYRFLLSKKQEERLKYFYILWTLKESYIKMKGKGLSIPLNSFTIAIENSKIAVLHGSEVVCCSVNFRNIDDEHILALCFQNNEFSNVYTFSVGQFFSYYK